MFYQRNSILNMFTTEKITNLTWFDVTIREQMFRKVVKLILTGCKNEKNIDHCRCIGLLRLNLDQITDSHLVNDFRIKTF